MRLRDFRVSWRPIHGETDPFRKWRIKGLRVSENAGDWHKGERKRERGREREGKKKKVLLLLEKDCPLALYVYVHCDGSLYHKEGRVSSRHRFQAAFVYPLR